MKLCGIVSGLDVTFGLKAYVSPQAMKTQLEKGEKHKPRTLSGYFHTPCPCSFRNYSFHPKPIHKWQNSFFSLVLQNHKFLSLRPPGILFIPYTVFFCPKTSLTDPYKRLYPGKKWKMNNTVCQFSNKVGQCVPINVMSSRAPRVALCFGNHTARKSNKQ